MTDKRRAQIPEPTKKAMELFPEPSQTDVNGSYTGRPQNKKEVPVQDADDLWKVIVKQNEPFFGAMPIGGSCFLF